MTRNAICNLFNSYFTIERMNDHKFFLYISNLPNTLFPVQDVFIGLSNKSVILRTLWFWTACNNWKRFWASAKENQNRLHVIINHAWLWIPVLNKNKFYSFENNFHVC